MAQLSRPFQIAVLALAVLALASFAVLHRAGGASTNSSSPSVASSAGSPSVGTVPRTTSGGTAPRAAVKPASALHSTTALHPTTAVHPKRAAAAPTRTSHAHSGTAAASQAHGAPAMQAKVAAELKHGKVVLLLFWNRRSTNDDLVAIVTAVAVHRLGHSVAVHRARADQISSFGSITRAIQLYQTPTLLIINPKLQVTTLTGFTDVYSIEQAVAEARK